ncbi:hydroperoxide isomerase ALOXE3 isoform X2 [Onychostoma macrolepis]|uniref:hydroperoxide isomerase ALOXE3 isoform X2 n=1 Tax=Onychostoma macrolepis TaxID=369639 RepID=UPI00272CB537|nr:hydroperoxide isomerase ALOXE3 isoform X2 [Onychostoma macrolepis]
MEAIYDVEVTTGSMTHAGTFDNIFITLIGTQGVSERTKLDSYGRDFKTGMKVKYKMITRFTLANLLLIRLEKDNFMYLPENDWFCSLVNVRTPEKDVIHFPCYRWMGEGEVIELREAKATKTYEEKYSQLKEHRKNELKHNKQVYQWTEFKAGLPQHACFQEPLSVPLVVRFSFSKDMDSAFNCSTALGEIKMKKLAKKPDQWVKMEDMKTAFWSSRTAVSEYVQLHWMDDDFFGYQLLNGSNPMMLRRCTELPLNFAVTNGMVQPFLESGTSLTMEMKLQQQASEDNPVFLPSDSEYDWQLSKLHVGNANCLEHQASFYLRTHLAETFSVSVMRNLPAAHPIHKLLVPHTRYTLQINTLIRNRLLGPEGAVTQNTSIGDEGMTNLMKAALSDLTYSSLCLPEDISDRGLESIPNFFYRDDGLHLWSFINDFVRSMVEFYYQSDRDVQQDTELQDWIKEIFIHGFLEQSSTGIPQCFSTVEEVIQFVTMVIFTVSAQHSALRAGQFDYGSWFPNAPGSLKRPPPTSKGSSEKNTLLDTLPDMNTSACLVSVFWLLSKPSTDLVPLGQYPEDYFCQMAPQKMIRDFQAELSFFSESVNDRNKGLQVPYTYMCPDNISNSVSI